MSLLFMCLELSMGCLWENRFIYCWRIVKYRRFGLCYDLGHGFANSIFLKSLLWLGGFGIA
jgi:hypothetical protein